MAATAVKERPIIMSEPMVRAILEGRKTQTRRVVKLAARLEWAGAMNPEGKPIVNRQIDKPGGWRRNGTFRSEVFHGSCPYGAVGDRLWVRETWAETSQAGIHENDSHIVYRATDPDWQSMTGWRWRSPVHMPRSASRITLEITEVRVQRLREISEADAIAEGAQCAGFPASLTNRGAFAKLWESLHGAGSWEANPWVWAITFRRVYVGRTGANDGK